MSLIVDSCTAHCDVEGCDRQAIGKISQLAQAGWSVSYLLGGERCLTSILTPCHDHRVGHAIICPTCSVQGHWKKMVKDASC
jgi:hypothetical protein